MTPACAAFEREFAVGGRGHDHVGGFLQGFDVSLRSDVGLVRDDDERLRPLAYLCRQCFAVLVGPGDGVLGVL